MSAARISEQSNSNPIRKQQATSAGSVQADLWDATSAKGAKNKPKRNGHQQSAFWIGDTQMTDNNYICGNQGSKSTLTYFDVNLLRRLREDLSQRQELNH